MAVCPYLLLEEQGSSPFPFPSVSHRCHVTGTGVPVGQREQRTYCLVKRHTLCPFFPVQEAVAIELDTILESAPPARAETPTKEPDTIAESLPPAIPVTPQIELETIPESPSPTVPAIPSTESPPDLQAVADAVPEFPTPEAGEVLHVEAPIQPVAEPVAAGELERAAAEEQGGTAISPEPAAPARTHPAAKETAPARIALRPMPQLPSRALAWTAVVASVCMVMLCIGALTVYGVARVAATGLPSFGTAELLPAVLLFLSVVSFLVAFALVGLLLWARRRAP